MVAPAPVTAFVGVPVVEGLTARGVLVGDRADGRRFEEPDVALMTNAAAQVVRVVQSERTSLCNRSSNGPASTTYRRTAESVQSPSR